MMKDVSDKLFAAGKVLIMTHRRPDGDALGSSMGLAGFLRNCGIEAVVMMPDNIPPRFSTLALPYVTEVSAGEIDGFDLFVAVDCANGERLGCGKNLTVEQLRSRNFVSIDHHRGNILEAPCQWIEPSACSASFMVAKLLLATGRELTAEVATLLMTGIMTDTGSFSFSNTDAAAFRVAAELAERGAAIERIANAVFFSKPLNQLHFEAELVNTCFKIECGGKFAYAFVPEELMAKYNFDMREDEGLIDLLRCIDGAVIAMLCHKRADGIRVSLRSKDGAFPVGPIARKLGGGGHDMAAGTTLAMSWQEAEAVMLKEISELLKN